MNWVVPILEMCIPTDWRWFVAFSTSIWTIFFGAVVYGHLFFKLIIQSVGIAIDMNYFILITCLFAHRLQIIANERESDSECKHHHFKQHCLECNSHSFSPKVRTATKCWWYFPDFKYFIFQWTWYDLIRN